MAQQRDARQGCRPVEWVVVGMRTLVILVTMGFLACGPVTSPTPGTVSQPTAGSPANQETETRPIPSGQPVRKDAPSPIKTSSPPRIADGQTINGCRIERGTQCRGARLAGISILCEYADLNRADLSGVDLRGTTMRCSLVGANLSKANLSGADLRGQYLDDANARGADLSNANLQRASLIRADFTGAILDKADLDWSVDGQFKGASLRGASLRGKRLTKEEAEGADWTGAKTCFTVLPDREMAFEHCRNIEISGFYRGIKAPNVDFTGSRMHGIFILGSVLTGAILVDTNLESARIEHTDLTGADLRRANLRSTSLIRSNLTGANLSGTKVAGVNLRGAKVVGDELDLRGTTLCRTVWVDGSVRNDHCGQ